MLMSSMREKTKIVLFVALIAFVGLIFFDWGMQKGGSGPQGPGGVVAKVNDRDISWDAYRQLRQQTIQNFESRAGRTAEYSDYDAIDEEVWIKLIREAVVLDQIEKFDIVISDAEILETLRTNPPPAIRAGFVDAEGQFDVAAYSQALADPGMAPQWAAVEDFLRSSMPPDKIQNYVGLAARVTSAELRERFLARNEKVTVRYVAASAPREEVTALDASDATIQNYYQSHTADYETQERAILDFVRVSKSPTSEDSSSTREYLDDLLKDIREGADFADLASNWSDDTSAERGGDLGMVGRGDMVPEFESVAWSTPIGEVSDVFSTPFGYHIVKVDARGKGNEKDKLQLRHILLRVEASTETLRDAGERADDFLDAIGDGESFEAAAAEGGLEVEVTPPFESRQPIPGIGLLGRAGRFAFSNAVGTVVSDPIEDRTAIYMFRVADRLPAGLAPLEEITERVKADVLAEQKKELERTSLQQALDASDGSLDAVAKKLGAEPQETISFSRETFVPSIGRRNAFVAEAFSLAAGQRSGMIETDRGYYVLELVSREEADEATFTEQRDQIRQQLLTEKRQLLITAWLEQLIAGAEVTDYREGGDGVPWKVDPDVLYYSTGA